MKRKIVKQGEATYTVSIPAKWASEHHLSKGSEVDLDIVDDTIVISTKKDSKKSEVTIRLITSTESMIRTMITNAYRAGYDKIIVVYDHPSQLATLTSVIKTRLIGFDITKKEKNRCTVENITEPSADQFETILRKIFFSIEELLQITEKNLNGQEEDIEEVEERIQKYDNFCRRIITKTAIASKPQLLWTFLTLVVHAQREVYLLNKMLTASSVSKSVKDLMAQTKVLFLLLSKAFFEKDHKLLSEIHDREKDLIYKQGYALLKSTKNTESIIVYHLLSCIRQCYQSSSPLAALIL